MMRKYLLASLTAGASIVGTEAALCAGQTRGGNGFAPSDGLRVTGGGNPMSKKTGDNYMTRLVSFIQLMDPRHTLSSERELRRYQEVLAEHKVGKKQDVPEKELLRAAGMVAASCNPANGEVIPPPFRLSGYLLCNIPIVAAMLFTQSVYVQVISHWVNQSLNTAVNYYNRSGAEMTAKRVATSYALAVGSACPLAFGLGMAFQRAPPSLKRYSFLASYIAVAAAGSLNVLFTRASEISGGVKVTDQSGEVRGVSKKAGFRCVMQTVVSRGLILPLPVLVLPGAIVGVIEGRGWMPASPRARLWVQLGAITASLAIALPMSIAVFPQEACFRADSLEPELQSLRVKGGEFKGQAVTYLYANKGL